MGDSINMCDNIKCNNKKKRQIEIDLENGKKTCSICQIVKLLEDFEKCNRNGSPDTFRLQCKSCNNKIRKKKYEEWRRENPVKPRKELNLKKQNPIYKQYEESGQRKCNFCNETKELDKFRFRMIQNKYPAYNSRCKKCEKEESKLWKVKSRDAYLACKRRHNKKVRTSVMGKLNANMSSNIHDSLTGYNDGTSWKNMVGYDLTELKQHLESKFQLGMTWDNHGLGNNKWHIGHILPKRLFKFTSYKNLEFQICWSLDNLEPQWGLTNETKQDILDNGKYAKDLSEIERLEYLKSKGYDLFYLYPNLRDTDSQSSLTCVQNRPSHSNTQVSLDTTREIFL